MATDREDQTVKDAAVDLKDTPYELMYISKPTPTASRYAFQHTVATSPAEARTVIAEALQKLQAGEAEWSSGIRYGQNPGDSVPAKWAELYPDVVSEPQKKRKTRFTQSVGYNGKWVQQYYDAEIGNWFDIGDAYDTEEAAKEAAVKRGSWVSPGVS